MKNLFAFVVLAGIAASAHSAVLFNSEPNSDFAAGMAKRAEWLAAAGISSPTHLVDFENFAVGTSMADFAHAGSLVTRTTTTGAIDVRGAGAFGTSNPIDARGMWHNESPSLVLDFSGGPVRYIGGWDIDTGSWVMTITFDNAQTQEFTLDTTATSGNSAEFWGLVVDDNRFISKIEMNGSGSGGWGLDNLEYSEAVPEPATLAVLGLVALAASRKRNR